MGESNLKLGKTSLQGVMAAWNFQVSPESLIVRAYVRWSDISTERSVDPQHAETEAEAEAEGVAWALHWVSTKTQTLTYLIDK